PAGGGDHRSPGGDVVAAPRATPTPLRRGGEGRGPCGSRQSARFCGRNIAMTARDQGLATVDLSMVRRAARLALLSILVGGAAAAWYWRAVLDPAAITAALAAYPAAPLGFLALHPVASLMFVPRTLLAIVAGLLFGVGWGIIWAASGSV